ncbi:hypothetical protein NC652_012382 [Populus alba x Populus x berolinensis]|nr:hypothetical protein NC652_012382 [Populus alba x Populus x berolinensis]
MARNLGAQLLACRYRKILGSSSSTLKGLFYALKVNGILKCDIKEDVFEILSEIMKFQQLLIASEDLNLTVNCCMSVKKILISGPPLPGNSPTLSRALLGLVADVVRVGGCVGPALVCLEVNFNNVLVGVWFEISFNTFKYNFRHI